MPGRNGRRNLDQGNSKVSRKPTEDRLKADFDKSFECFGGEFFLAPSKHENLVFLWLLLALLSGSKSKEYSLRKIACRKVRPAFFAKLQRTEIAFMPITSFDIIGWGDKLYGRRTSEADWST